MTYVHATVEQGKLRGIDHAGVTSFLGVPYAADTSGANRFRSPQPAPHWKGVRDAVTFGPAAPQPDLRLSATGNLGPLLTLLSPRAGSPLEGGSIDEDCLRVNIWAPSCKQDGALPVLVWLHGGGYTFGSGSETAFHGDVLAAAGDVVVVSVTHRLGLLGFLDLRELGEPGSANAGLLDIVAALKWIQRNIAAFGGDPTRVTLCGQSGGGGKVLALNAMPTASDLFVRSIVMSGPFGRSHAPGDSALLRDRVMKSAGFQTVKELRAASVARLLEAQSAAQREVASMAAGEAGSLALDSALGFGPSLDPDDLPGNSFWEEATEGVRGKQMLLGWTSHDATFLLAANSTFTDDMSADEAASRVDVLSGIDGVTYADLSAQYPHEPPHLVLGRRMTSLMFAQPTRRIADLATEKADGVWVYEFAQPTEVLDGLLGATHSMELAFVFGTIDRVPLTGRALDRLTVSREMMRAWTSFAHSGDPGWEPWNAANAVHMFGTPYGPDLRLPENVDMAAPLGAC